MQLLRAGLADMQVPEGVRYVCRLACPWSELASYAASVDLDSLDDVTHRHIPYGAALDLEHPKTGPLQCSRVLVSRLAGVQCWHR